MPNFLNNTSHKKQILLIIFIVILLISVSFYIFRLFQRIQLRDRVFSKPHISYQPSNNYVPDEIIVNFREGYIPSDIVRDSLNNTKNEKSITGRLLNIVRKVDANLAKEKSPEEKLVILRRDFEKIGVISYSALFDSEDVSLKGFYVLKLVPNSNILEVQDNLSKIDYIYSTEANNLAELYETPNDPGFQQLWGMQKIQAPQAWDLAKGSTNITVGVIDSGIDVTHPDLSANMVTGYDFANNDSDPTDDVGHGSHVAGTIGAVGNNGIGVAGVNWNIGLMPLKVCVPYLNTARCPTAATTQAIEYAADKGVKVINMSLGGEGICGGNSAYQRAINYAISKGVVVVVAAGNDTKDASSYSPAGCSGVITIGATTPSDSRASFSNYGSVVDIAAPGTSIYSTWPGGYKSIQGTSMASPHVAGAAALLLSANPSLTVQQVRDCLVNNGDPITTDMPLGNVRLNVFKSLQACANSNGNNPSEPTATLVPGANTPTPTPSLAPGETRAPTATSTPGVPTKTPTPSPTPREFFTCEPDPKCVNSGKSIQLCPLICKPQ